MIPVWEILAKRQSLFLVEAFERTGERRVGAGLFVSCGRGSLALLGFDPGDYLDLLTDQSLTEPQAAEIKRGLVATLLETTRVGTIRFPHLREEVGTSAALREGEGGLHVTCIRSMPAPAMRLNGTKSRVDRSSFRRVENRLARQGKVTFEQYATPEEVLPRLQDFFEQHRQRWKGTPCERFFADERNQDFYRRLTASVGRTPWLRYAELRLDGRLAASHFGFRYRDRYLWYKPAFDPELGKLSPGIALIHRLMEQAVREGADEFDFTIGGEAFKSRYADVERAVCDLHVTKSWLRAQWLRSEMAGRRLARQAINQVWPPKRDGRC